MSKIAFIGGGSFGTALAVLLANKGNEVTVYDKDESVISDININKRNKKYLPELIIPDGVMATLNIKEAVKDVDFVVIAVPSHVVRIVAKELSPIINDKATVISIAKGIEEGTDKRLSEVLSDEINKPVVVLSGPSHA